MIDTALVCLEETTAEGGQPMNDEIFESRLNDLYMAIKETRDVADRYQDAFYRWWLRGLELAYRIMSGGGEA